LNSIDLTHDGGYILGGYSSSNISGDKTENRIAVSGLHNDYWVVKLDSVGNIIWENTIGSGKNDELNSIQTTQDGGFILGGISNSNANHDKTDALIAKEDYWAVKLDSLGNVEWDNALGGIDEDYLLTAFQLSDGGFILGGYSNSDNFMTSDKAEDNLGSFDFWIVKLNSEGVIEWENTIGGEHLDYFESLIPVADGFILGGHSRSAISSDKTQNPIGGFEYDYWIVKIDLEGNVIWDKTIGGTGEESFNSITATSDGGYMIGGTSVSPISGDKTENNIGAEDFWIVKLDSLGDVEWDKTIGGTGYDILESIFQVEESFILAGYSDSDASGNKSENSFGDDDFWVVRINALGEVEWDKTIGGTDDDRLLDAIKINDSEYILAGYSLSDASGLKTEGNNGSWDYWVVKLSPDPLSCSITSTISPSGPTSFCKPGSVILNAPIDASYTYQWKKNGGNIPGATSSTYTANKTGNYQVEVSNETCSDLSGEVTVVASAKPNAIITNTDATNDICFDTHIKLKTGAVAGYSYQWYNSTTPISGAISNIYFATAAGSYRVKVTNSIGCFKLSTPYEIINSCRIGDENGDVLIYPNPAQTELFIQTDGFNKGEIKIIIYNSTGQKIFSQSNNNSELVQINITEFNAGIYTVIISDNEKMATKQFVKE
ncbi:MAG: T9SS type A sorting domain-containing protein, partial [Chitinophagales bacterium]|nr:T9SS type A sorting domain-containing protein [Chitinophagales bacterium]